MMWHYYGQMWIWMLTTTVLGWAIVIGIVVLVLRWLLAPPSDGDNPRKT